MLSSIIFHPGQSCMLDHVRKGEHGPTTCPHRTLFYLDHVYLGRDKGSWRDSTPNKERFRALFLWLEFVMGETRHVNIKSAR